MLTAELEGAPITATADLRISVVGPIPIRGAATYLTLWPVAIARTAVVGEPPDVNETVPVSQLPSLMTSWPLVPSTKFRPSKRLSLATAVAAGPALPGPCWITALAPASAAE